MTMPRQLPIRLLPILPVLGAALLLSACPEPELDPPEELPVEPEPEPEPTPEPRIRPGPDLDQLEVDDDTVRGADGTVLLEIDDVPGDMPVDADTEFGAATHFTEASVSPDGEWLAVVTGSAAHSGGWLVRVETRAPRPAAFQYGGGITIGPWSDEARRVVFVHEGPAGDRTLTVVDRQRLGDTADESGMAVRVPDHDDRPPEERRYEAVVWRDGRLVFQVDGERWVFDPDTGDVEREG